MSAAVLYADPAGPYPLLCRDVWTKSRDARGYAGPYPVVAHPPCGPWGRLKAFCTRQDPQLAVLAVDQVRRWGGVLEHPEGSSLWERCGLPSPFERVPLIAPREWSLTIDQARFGHPCRKQTWLFFSGVNPAHLPPLPVRREPSSVITTSSDAPTLPPLVNSGRLSRDQLRRITPPDFARWLLAAALSCSHRETPQNYRP